MPCNGMVTRRPVPRSRATTVGTRTSRLVPGPVGDGPAGRPRRWPDRRCGCPARRGPRPGCPPARRRCAAPAARDRARAARTERRRGRRTGRIPANRSVAASRSSGGSIPGGRSRASSYDGNGSPEPVSRRSSPSATTAAARRPSRRRRRAHPPASRTRRCPGGAPTESRIFSFVTAGSLGRPGNRDGRRPETTVRPGPGGPGRTVRWWRCRESNPGPSPLCQGFSERSSLCLYSAPPITRASRCDGPSR